MLSFYVIIYRYFCLNIWLSLVQIRTEVRRLGGGYGSKLTRNIPVGAACALAAYVTDKPVAMALSLDTNMQLLGKR